ncbi:hypothetical protein [Streptomyces sp. NRRL S-920]|uniref:hypothetical protein n=1 Tax=Streptomyces sp. NRRL S-920 TaxID=1463921 RepID=UPI0004C6EF77|nr:hypothetical protein [Streptomyces sp. NRRL S-920]
MSSPFTRPDAPAQPPGGARRFTAELATRCACGNHIEPGDKAGLIDDEPVASCGDCCDEAEDNDHA